MSTVLRLGDVEMRPEEALELSVKTTKCTALNRPKGWKKFSRREANDTDEVATDDAEHAIYAQLNMRTEYYIDRSEDKDDADDSPVERENLDGDGDISMKEMLEKVEKEQLVRGFKYGSTYAPCPDGEFPRLKTVKGIDICGFFQAKNVRILPLSFSRYLI